MISYCECCGRPVEGIDGCFHCLYEEPERKKNEQAIKDFVLRLSRERGAIVSSGDCSEMEIANARAHGRFLIISGMGFVMRFREWRELAEKAIPYYVDHTEPHDRLKMAARHPLDPEAAPSFTGRDE